MQFCSMCATKFDSDGDTLDFFTAHIKRNNVALKLLASVTEADGKDEYDLFHVHPPQFPAAGSY